jgi:hypothetical protein
MTINFGDGWVLPVVSKSRQRSNILKKALEMPQEGGSPSYAITQGLWSHNIKAAGTGILQE